MPNCPSRPILLCNCICMSEAEESLRSSQPQRHSLRAQRPPQELLKHRHPSGESESEGLHRTLTGGERSASSLTWWKIPATTGATVPRSWDNKYHRETLEFHQKTETRGRISAPFAVATGLTHSRKPMNLLPLLL